MKTFKHKTILITGASSGIGAAMARQLADPTVTLLLTARSEDQLHALADEVAAWGTSTAVFPHDLSEPGAGSALHDQIQEAGHTVDVLVNNAGFGKQGPFDSYDADAYAAMIGLNVTNLVTLTRRCIPDMLQRGDAGILNVSSTAAYQPLPYFAIYAATKSFVTNFSGALHGEYADRGITVTCLTPGPTETNFQERAEMKVLTNYLGSAEDVARAGLKGLLQERMTVIPTPHDAVGAALGKLAPNRMSAAVIRTVMRQFFDPAPAA